MIARSAIGFAVSVSVALLLPGVGSVVPAGTVTVAVLTRLPVALADTVPVSVNVAVPAGQQVHQRIDVAGTARRTAAAGRRDTGPASANVMAAGTVSATVAPVTALGPLLLATIV